LFLPDSSSVGTVIQAKPIVTFHTVGEEREDNFELAVRFIAESQFVGED
jgi:hypothetical protein